MDKKPLTVSEAGKKGGTKTAEGHGEEFYTRIGREGRAVREKNKKLGLKPKPKIAGGKMTTAEAGAKGGSKTAAIHGHEHYKEIGRRGGQKTVAKCGLKFYSEIGNKGGSKRAKQHEGSEEAVGKVSLEEAGHIGGQRVRRLIQLGKKYEKE